MSTRRSLTFSRRNLLGVAASMALLIGLAGCTTPSPSPTGVTTASPKPTPAASVPHPIISVSCDQLLPMKTVQSAVTSPLTARVTEATPPASLADASYRQAGGFDCEWTASTASAGQPDGVSLIVLPDALDALTSFLEAVPVDPSTPCSGANGCDAEFAVGTSWVSLSARDSGSTLTDGTFTPLVARVTSTMTAAAAANDAWTPPSGSFSGAYFCQYNESVAAHLATAVGAPADLSAGGVGGGPGIDVTASQKTGVTFCPWLFSKSTSDDTELDIATLPGGAWATDSMNDWRVRPGGDMTITAVSVTGAQSARAGCATYGCSGYLSYRNSLISVGIDAPMSLTDFTTLLRKLIDGLS